MKVIELRAELKKRGLETGGVKAELTTRLSEALDADDSDGESADTERDKKEEEEEEEEEKQQKRQKSESESSASPDEVDSPLLPFSECLKSSFHHLCIVLFF